MDKASELLSKQDVIVKLQACGVTPTMQRVAIGRFLFAKPQHVSAEQVLEMVSRMEVHVSKATVYNTLNLFAGCGLVREVIVDPAKIFYDSNIEPHHHLFDVDTGALFDMPPESFEMQGSPELPEGAVMVGIDVVVRIRKKTDGE